jgi:hypothetical protein
LSLAHLVLADPGVLEEEVEGGGKHAEHDEEQNCDKEILCYLKKKQFI